MATKRRGNRRKRGSNFVAIPFRIGVTMLSLGNNLVVKSSAFTMGEDLFVISVDLACHIRQLTAGEGDPCEVGICHGDLSITEVSEALEAELTDPDDIIQKERSRRPVRRAGYCVRVGSDDTALALSVGQQLRVPAKFSVGDGHALEFWVANRSGNALTSGAIADFVGTIYGRWQR